MLLNKEKRLAEKIAFSFLGKPYLWGGDDPMAGFDCSGFCIEVLKSVGALPLRGDWTAHSLSKLWPETYNPSFGCLAFWGSSAKITHVEFMLDNKYSIGASGGGSKTKTVQDAINQNAYIKIRPIKHRQPLMFNNPFFEF